MILESTSRGMELTYSRQHLDEATQITSAISAETVESMVQLLKEVKNNRGRIFFLGVGGSAANASHAVNDFRKLAGIESYAPTEPMMKAGQLSSRHG